MYLYRQQVRSVNQILAGKLYSREMFSNALTVKEIPNAFTTTHCRVRDWYLDWVLALSIIYYLAHQLISMVCHFPNKNHLMTIPFTAGPPLCFSLIFTPFPHTILCSIIQYHFPFLEYIMLYYVVPFSTMPLWHSLAWEDFHSSFWLQLKYISSVRQPSLLSSHNIFNILRWKYYNCIL